jgi:hypothetical protein
LLTHIEDVSLLTKLGDVCTILTQIAGCTDGIGVDGAGVCDQMVIVALGAIGTLSVQTEKVLLVTS